MWWYSLGIRIYAFIVRVFALSGNKKALQKVRYNSHYKKLSSSFDIWLHASSEGELEQAIPILQAVRASNNSIIVSIYSPSALKSVQKLKDEGLIDEWTMMPFDTSKTIGKQLIEIIQPKVFIGVKYDFFWNIISALLKGGVEVFWTNVFYEKTPYFLKQKQCVSILNRMNRIYVQDHSTEELFKLFGISESKLVISSDTRFLRTAQFQNIDQYPELSNSSWVIAGSTWPADEEYLLRNFDSILQKGRLILFPHEKYKKTFPDEITWKGEMDEFLSTAQHITKFKVFVITTRGVLKYCYRYAQLNYVGGGFGKGVHNLVEPAIYGKPLICGPNIGRFREAIMLMKSGQLQVVKENDGIPFNTTQKYLEISREVELSRFGLDQIKTDILAQLIH